MKRRARFVTAALACALTLAGCGDRSSGGAAPGGSSGSVTTASDRTAGTTIPDDFPLSSGMGGPADTVPTSRTGTGLRDLELCGTSPLRGLGTRDRMVADNSGGESADTRELLVLGAPEDAVRLAERLAGLASDCAEPDPGRDMETRTEVLASPFGPGPATTLLQTYSVDGEPGTGATVVHVVPVGAALLVSSTYGQWTRDGAPEAVDATVAPLRRTVAALTLFGETPTTSPSTEQSTEPSTEPPTGPPAEPTDSPTETPSQPTAPPSAPSSEPPSSPSTPAPTSPLPSGEPTQRTEEIPDDFPLLAGWPEDATAEPGADNGRQGPSRTAEAPELRACGQVWRDPEHVDRLVAGWANAEDYRSRQLTTYQDAAAADAAIEGLADHQRACPSEPVGEDGFGTTREVRPVELGDEAWAILERDTFDGSPSVFGESALVVRVGRALLVVRHGGHAGYPDGDGRKQVEAMGSQAAVAIAKMCLFTRTGC
ncbi:hypothetical protein [Nocardioides sp. zg-1230]|uniref:hypothetical protein n=1 Tax=Nocardioides sp. zg-1230 TaxID=2736601 RepID=UPI001555B28E|nr:hypothetical protein [Nocardioides sp. zg-1230]NPC42550.1 hypothetical protein [Nocardioides sp. zg-1230]